MNLSISLSLGSTHSAGFNPAAALFGAGEQGYWLDPSDFSTMFQDTAGATPVTAVGQSVRRMLDKSGRGNTFTQANVANAPILQQDASGRYFLLFDGVDDWLQSAATINPGAVDKAQVFAGVRKLSDAAQGTVLETNPSLGANFGGVAVFAPPFTDGGFAVWSRGTNLSHNAFSHTPLSPTTQVVSGIADIAADNAVLRLNGTQVSASAQDQGTGNFLTYTHFIGRRGGTSMPFNGRLYQLIARYGANLSAGQITQTETFVNQRTGAF